MRSVCANVCSRRVQMHHPGVSYGSAEETDIHQIGDRQEDGARTVESLTPKKCCSKGSYCRRAYHGYFFKSKALALVLILNALFSTAIYGVASEVLTIIIGPQYVLTRNVVLHGLTQILFPIAGHIADTYVGKHKAIRFSFWLAWLGFAVLSISFSLDPFDDHINRANRYAILPITFTLLSIAYVIFMATIIPFGIDQLQGASHVHYRSFFYWWYWTLNIGVALVNYPQYCGKRVELKFIIQALVGLVCVSAALIIDVLLRHWFVIEPKSTKNNPLKQIARILRYVAKASPDRQRIPSTVRHELDMDHFGRLDLAKKRYGGQYETEEVEDVRTFFRILILLFAIGFAVLSYATIFGTVDAMATHMDSALATERLETQICEMDFTIMAGVNALVILVLIPLLDLVVIPLLQNLNLSILRRIGVGTFLTFISLLVLLLLEGAGRHSSDDVCMFRMGEELEGKLKVNVYWVLLPLVTVTVAELLVYIPGFEFICAQSPYNMRGLLIGIFFSIQGTFSLISVVLQYLFRWHEVYGYPFIGKTGYACGFWFYFIFTGLSVLGLFLYCLVAYKYKKRQRDDVFNEIAMIEEYFSSGLLNTDPWNPWKI